jgi:hypothetical protein
LLLSMLSGLAERRTAVGALSVALAILGGIVLTQMPLQLLPEIHYPQVRVISDIAGQTAAVIEESVNEPIEAALIGVPGIVHLESRSGDGRSYLDLFFAPGYDLDRALFEQTQRVLGTDHPLTLTVRSNLGADLRAGGVSGGAAALEQDGGAGPRDPVQLAVGVEERERERPDDRKHHEDGHEDDGRTHDGEHEPRLRTLAPAEDAATPLEPDRHFNLVFVGRRSGRKHRLWDISVGQDAGSPSLGPIDGGRE